MLCKYRSKVVGFEDEVGLEQVSHHHHVEGIGLGGEGGVHGGHSHDHSHDHHHHPYPHADHPLGPKSMVKD
jgi:sirohydrochlorin cobaltochelatase